MVDNRKEGLGFEWMVGVSNAPLGSDVTGSDDFDVWKRRMEKDKDWMFGFLSYDLKNQTERLRSSNPSVFDWPDLHFFLPEILIRLESEERLRIESATIAPEKIWASILGTSLLDVFKASPVIQCRTTKEEYLDNVRRIQDHILQGDIYEMNYCVEFYAENVELSPSALFTRLNSISKAPFGGFLKYGTSYLACGSPERFLKKEENRIISQPIKGTAPRGNTPEEDERLRELLFNSNKDRSENVMIVDLVRNDLSRVCRGVEVEELFGIYDFEQVWQMISTIKGTLRPGCHGVDAIKAAWPMGSMTGAPKIRAMELIDEFENFKRGMYSGSIGYVSPTGDFDFNVVIRSILFDSEQKYLSFPVGGAIVFDSDPEKEWEECLLKASSMRLALS